MLPPGMLDCLIPLVPDDHHKKSDGEGGDDRPGDAEHDPGARGHAAAPFFFQAR